MKKLSTIICILTVLMMCLPADGEIIIYRKLLKCWQATEDGEQWTVSDQKIKGFLVLDIVYDANGAIDSIDDAYQVEYGKNSEGNKVYSSTEHDGLDVVRVQGDNSVEWIFVETDFSGDSGDITLLRGAAVSSRIGNADPNEVARQLNGKLLSYSPDEGADVFEICQWNLRLHQSWTKLANEEGLNIYDALDLIIEFWLNWRQYEPGEL